MFTFDGDYKNLSFIATVDYVGADGVQGHIKLDGDENTIVDKTADDDATLQEMHSDNEAFLNVFVAANQKRFHDAYYKWNTRR